MNNIDNQEPGTIFSLKAWGSVILAILIMVVVAFGLSWQYERIARESEEKMSSLEDMVEGSLVQDVLDRFLTARINKNEDQAAIYLTERAMEQRVKGQFSLVDDFESYQVIKKEKLAGDSASANFEFFVKIYSKDRRDSVIEIIVLTKIIDSYYVDSVEIAG